MNTLTAPERLRHYIQRNTEALAAYAQRDQASATYIEKRNEDLKELTAIYNALLISEFAFAEYWIKAEQFLQIITNDSQIGELVMRLRIRDNGVNAYLDLNPPC